MYILNSSRQNQVTVIKEALSKYLSTFFGVKFILLEAGPFSNILRYSFLTLNERKTHHFVFLIFYLFILRFLQISGVLHNFFGKKVHWKNVEKTINKNLHRFIIHAILEIM